MIKNSLFIFIFKPRLEEINLNLFEQWIKGAYLEQKKTVAVYVALVKLTGLIIPA